MATTYEGSCKCGAIKIEVQGDPSFVVGKSAALLRFRLILPTQGICHCHNCQKSTGSAFSTNWVVPKPGFKVISGKSTTYEVKGGSGNPALCQFCGTCGSTMWTESAAFPDIIVVKAGILDNAALAKFPPGIEAFTSRKPAWVKEVENAKQFVEAFHA
jgi:hypothetical protein